MMTMCSHINLKIVLKMLTETRVNKTKPIYGTLKHCKERDRHVY